MKKQFFIQLSAMFLMVLTISTSLNLPIIEHECNFSKMKSYHLYSYDHKCSNDACHIEKEPSKDIQFSKVPCCNLETTFVNNTEPVLVTTKISIVQVSILTELFSYVIAPLKYNFVEDFVPLEQHNLYGFQYRIALQSFQC